MSWLRITTSLVSVVCLLPANAGGESLPYYNSAEFTPHWLEVDAKELRDFHRIPPFTFTNQDGEEISERDVAGGIYVANFFFTSCPGICPAIRKKLAVVQEEFRDDDYVKILTHTIRPTTDSSEMLRAYAKANDIQSGKWHLLTGDKEAIYRLAKETYFADEDLGEARSNEDFLHTENLLLIDEGRRIRGVYNGLSSSAVENLVEDIRLLKAAARTSYERE